MSDEQNPSGIETPSVDVKVEKQGRNTVLTAKMEVDGSIKTLTYGLDDQKFADMKSEDPRFEGTLKGVKHHYVAVTNDHADQILTSKEDDAGIYKSFSARHGLLGMADDAWDGRLSQRDKASKAPELIAAVKEAMSDGKVTANEFRVIESSFETAFNPGAPPKAQDRVNASKEKPKER